MIEDSIERPNRRFRIAPQKDRMSIDDDSGVSDLLTNGAAEVFLIVSKQDAILLTTVSQQLRVVCSLTKYVGCADDIVPVGAEVRRCKTRSLYLCWRLEGRL